jgi:lactate racemase
VIPPAPKSFAKSVKTVADSGPSSRFSPDNFAAVIRWQNMRVQLAFGKTGVTADLPAGFRYRLLEARTAQPLDDPASAIAAALDAPIASPPLEELARGKSSAAISVCDITRPAPNKLVLPPLLERLHRAGIPRERTTILIATGLHRPATDSEIREIVGETIASTYLIGNHNARNRDEHRFIGVTRQNTPVWVDERFVAADLHITLGFIEPHLMLGYSGGRKLIAPGLAAQETIKVLHSPKFMRDSRAVEGSVEDNPLHRELIEIAAMARHDFMVDAALTRDRRIAGVFGGNAVEAHRQGRQFVSQVMLEKLDSPVDAVITTSAGYPLDLTFYQAIKGITAASHILKPGGRILLVAACQEGAGAPEFSRMVKENPSDRAFMDKLLTAPVEVDQWQLEKLGLITAKHEVHFYVPGVESGYHASLWGKSYATLHQAVEGLTRGLPSDATIAVIPEGPYVLARAEAHDAEMVNA